MGLGYDSDASYNVLRKGLGLDTKARRLTRVPFPLSGNVGHIPKISIPTYINA